MFSIQNLKVYTNQHQNRKQIKIRKEIFMLKNNLVKQFYYCNAIANDIIKHNKSKEIQEYAKQFAEIESPLVGGTYADWIRIF